MERHYEELKKKMVGMEDFQWIFSKKEVVRGGRPQERYNEILTPKTTFQTPTLRMVGN